MNPKILELAKSQSALDAIRKGLIRCGFELEFHAVNGLSRDPEDDDSGGADLDAIAEEISAPHIEVGDDSSVRGGEVRTLGALTPQKFMAAATALFSGHDFEIDTGCSFHIHLSVVGVRHSYGKAQQSEMMAFLLQNLDRIPGSVKERMKSDAIRFFKFKLDGDKMRAVHGHPLKTWEFRLFGNITTEHEAWQCLLLAIDTMRHAYRVKCGISKSLLTPEILVDFDTLAGAAVANQRSLTQQLRYNKLFANTQSA
jgi:hypothetical protein